MSAAESAYLFRHALVRDAAYALQPPGARAVLHGVSAELMAAAGGAGADQLALEIADHAAAARLGGTPGDWLRLEREWLARGAKFAEMQFENEIAARAYARLAELQDRGTEPRLHSMLRWAEMEHHCARSDRALKVLAELFDEGKDLELPLIWDAYRYRSAVYMDLARYAESEADLEMVLKHRDDASPMVVRRVRYSLALHRIHDGDELVAEFRQLRKECLEQDDIEFAGQVTSAEGNVLRDMGRYEEAEACLVDGVELCRKVGQLGAEGVATGMLGRVHHERGDLTAARTTYRQALAILQRTGDLRFQGIIGGLLADVLHQDNRTAEARIASDRAVEVLRDCGAADDFVAMTPQRARLLAAQGEREAAVSLLDESETIVRQLNLPHRIEAVAAARKDIQHE